MRKWNILLLLLLAGATAARAQAPVPDYAATDSLVQALAGQYRWAALDSVGQAALRLGLDYPALRRRLGQAALAHDRPAAAIRHYGRALRENPTDTTARYGLALAYLSLNQPGPAALVARGLPDSLRRPLHLNGFQLLSRVEVEASGQSTRQPHRGPAGFLRLGVGTRLSPRLSLSQSVSYFGQNIELPDHQRRGRGDAYPVRQNEYYALLAGQLAPRWRVLLGYHFLDSDFGRLETTNGHLGYAALAYTRPYWAVQVGQYVGTLTDTARAQTDLRLTLYPLGNLRLYGFGQASVVRSNGRSYPHALLGAGGRLHRHAWLDVYGGLGQVPVLAGLDGLYVYNLLDPLQARAGAGLLILLPQRLSLRLSAGLERRRDAVNGSLYNLQSLSTALAWTW
ncbi:tetratricopeptide (TPR) repeat protein [Hymenobacter sp. UYAg731]